MLELIDIDAIKDRGLMADWLQRQHVVRWWGCPEARLQQFDGTPDDNHAFIARSGDPIGYLRWQAVDLSDLEAVGLSGIPEGSIDIDMFLGNPGDLSQSYGPMALELLVERLNQSTQAPLVGLCTSITNSRAIRAFEKAGFTKQCQFDDPTFGPCFVMTRWLHGAK